MIKELLCEIKGGLGNQMFCYAAGMAVSENADVPLVLDLSEFDDDKFGRSYMLMDFSICASSLSMSRMNVVGKVWRKIKLAKYECAGNQIRLSVIMNAPKRFPVYLDGNWHDQDYHIFHSYREKIKQEFTYKGVLSASYTKLFQELSPFHTVAIHLRYGDYVKIGCCMDKSFYGEAIRKLDNYLCQVSKPVRLVVFSEDIDTSRSIIDAADQKYEKIYVTRECGLSDVEEFLLMQNCDDHIISNSTFSWWAAYLHDGGTTVAPIIRNWIKNEWEEDYFPEDWITIETKLG